MAKTTGPLFSLDARNSLGKAIVYSIWKGINYVRRHVVPQNPQTDDQLVVRQIITDGSQKWKDGTISSGDKADWNTAAAGQPYSGFNLYMKNYYNENIVLGPPLSIHSPQVIPTPPTP